MQKTSKQENNDPLFVAKTLSRMHDLGAINRKMRDASKSKSSGTVTKILRVICTTLYWSLMLKG